MQSWSWNELNVGNLGDGADLLDGDTHPPRARCRRRRRCRGRIHVHRDQDPRLITALGLDGKDERLIAIVGVADETKGEAVLLLAALDVDLAQLRDKLRDTGVPNLWIPKKISRVGSIPVLASGKLDLAKCKELAVEN